MRMGDRTPTGNTLVNVYVDLLVFTRIAVLLHRPDVVNIGVIEKHAEFKSG